MQAARPGGPDDRRETRASRAAACAASGRARLPARRQTEQTPRFGKVVATSPYGGTAASGVSSIVEHGNKDEPTDRSRIVEKCVKGHEARDACHVPELGGPPAAPTAATPACGPMPRSRTWYASPCQTAQHEQPNAPQKPFASDVGNALA
ncbi:hypothetical protein, partial [Burkholderia sp. MSMB1459WGS]|uniref:hypothetical protein n=1 Tax=Burkholderia sp. MSMB1459WGS TaxID=1637970 RepID=UPI001C54D053